MIRGHTLYFDACHLSTLLINGYWPLNTGPLTALLIRPCCLSGGDLLEKPDANLLVDGIDCRTELRVDGNISGIAPVPDCHVTIHVC